MERITGDKREREHDQLAVICRMMAEEMAEEQRRTELAGAFQSGEHAIRSMAAHDIALVVASMDLCKHHYVMSDLEAAAQERMMNDPIFHAAVSHLTVLLDEYIAAALRYSRSC